MQLRLPDIQLRLTDTQVRFSNLLGLQVQAMHGQWAEIQHSVDHTMAMLKDSDACHYSEYLRVKIAAGIALAQKEQVLTLPPPTQPPPPGAPPAPGANSNKRYIYCKSSGGTREARKALGRHCLTVTRRPTTPPPLPRKP